MPNLKTKKRRLKTFLGTFVDFYSANKIWNRLHITKRDMTHFTKVFQNIYNFPMFKHQVFRIRGEGSTKS
jgi:hypothetical protein